MWFRNLQVYRFTPNPALDLNALNDILAAKPLVPCSGLERQRFGWLRAHGEAVVYQQNGQALLSLGSDEKILPASVVKRATEEKIAQITEAEGHRPGGKRKKEIKEEIEVDLLPRAFHRRTSLNAWLDPTHGYLVIDAPSSAKAEEFLKEFGDVFSDLDTHGTRTQTAPSAAMSAWVSTREAPTGFTIDRDCELRLPGDEGSSVRYSHHPLEGDDIIAHIAGGKEVIRLGLTWNDRVSFQLTQKMEIKSLSFLDVVKESTHSAEDAEALFQVEFALMTMELQQALPDLMSVLGGEVG